MSIVPYDFIDQRKPIVWLPRGSSDPLDRILKPIDKEYKLESLQANKSFSNSLIRKEIMFYYGKEGSKVILLKDINDTQAKLQNYKSGDIFGYIMERFDNENVNYVYELSLLFNKISLYCPLTDSKQRVYCLCKDLYEKPLPAILVRTYPTEFLTWIHHAYEDIKYTYSIFCSDFNRFRIYTKFGLQTPKKGVKYIPK